MKKTHHSKNLEETEELAQRVARWIVKQKPNQKALVLALTGKLGSGKTTFVQDLAQSLGVEEKILSPTFVILKKFDLPSLNFETFYHVDCYRIEDPEELLKLGFEEIVQDPQNVVVIEWADKVKSTLPSHYLKLDFEVEGRERKINIKSIQNEE